MANIKYDVVHNIKTYGEGVGKHTISIARWNDGRPVLEKRQILAEEPIRVGKCKGLTALDWADIMLANKDGKITDLLKWEEPDGAKKGRGKKKTAKS